MTEEKLKAGPMLDAMVAEALGWTAYLEKRSEYELAVRVPPGGKPPWESYRRGEMEKHRHRQVSCAEAAKVGFYGEPFPLYSTRIEDAWLVVEKMRERGLYVGFDSNAAAPDVWRFWAQDEEGEYVASGEAPTAPLAACKMALSCLAAAGEKGGT